MYNTLLILHSTLRWIALGMLLFTLYKVFRGYTTRVHFSSLDNGLRHWTATLFHMQLVVGFMLYLNSPIVQVYWKQGIRNLEVVFFSLLHFGGMLAAIVVITIGSALSKRRSDDRQKQRTLLLWFGIALLIILIAIPWPFSPLAARPYWRH